MNSNRLLQEAVTTRHSASPEEQGEVIIQIYRKC